MKIYSPFLFKLQFPISNSPLSFSLSIFYSFHFSSLSLSFIFRIEQFFFKMLFAENNQLDCIKALKFSSSCLPLVWNFHSFFCFLIILIIFKYIGKDALSGIFTNISFIVMQFSLSLSSIHCTNICILI